MQREVKVIVKRDDEEDTIQREIVRGAISNVKAYLHLHKTETKVPNLRYTNEINRLALQF